VQISILMIVFVSISCVTSVLASVLAWRWALKTHSLLWSQEEMRTTADDVSKLLPWLQRIQGQVGHLMKSSKGRGSGEAAATSETTPMDKDALRAHFGLALLNARNHQHAIANPAERLRRSGTAKRSRAQSHQQDDGTHHVGAEETEES